jgi:hypothetical protein
LSTRYSALNQKQFCEIEKENEMKFRSIASAFAVTLVLVLISSAPVTAQSTPASGTASLQTFNIERLITIADILTTITPNLSASELAALAGGALEIHEVLAYNPQANTLTSTVFAVPTGSPLPTPPAALAALPVSSIVEISTMVPDKIYVTTTPFMSVTFVGSVVQSTATPYGSYLGAVATISVGFTSDTPPKVNTVVESIAGALVAYSASAAVNEFTVTLPPSPPGGGTGSKNPTVVITPPNQTVLVSTVYLNASASTDPQGLALTYQWTLVSGGSAALINANQATATAILGSGAAHTYTFMVTVTDSAGNSSTATTTIAYAGP